MCLAESRLTESVVQRKLTLGHQQIGSEPTTPDYGYASTKVTADFQRALARYLNKTLRCEVSIDEMVLGGGAGTAVESLVFLVTDPGDGILLPTPYYPGFTLDLLARSGVEIVPVPRTAASNFALEQASLEAAMGSTTANVKALLLTSPCNPTTQVLSADTLMMALDFATRHDLQLICDEVYAGSTLAPEGFVSALEIARSHSQQATERCHVVWGLAKDFPLAGLRVACSIIRDPELRAALQVQGRFHGISSDTMRLLTKMLADQEFTSSFAEQNCRNLNQRHKQVAAALKSLSVPVVPAEAGLFVWMNLRQWLPSDSWDGELELWQEILDRAKVNITRGEACATEQPGWFRMCCAHVDDETLDIVISRLSKVLSS